MTSPTVTLSILRLLLRALTTCGDIMQGFESAVNEDSGNTGNTVAAPPDDVAIDVTIQVKCNLQ